MRFEAITKEGEYLQLYPTEGGNLMIDISPKRGGGIEMPLNVDAARELCAFLQAWVATNGG